MHDYKAMIKKILKREKLNIFGYSSLLYGIGEIFDFILRIIAEIIKPTAGIPERPSKNFEDLVGLIGGIPSRERIAMLTLKEAAYIFKTVKENRPKALLEIGIFKGGTTLLLSAAKPDESKLISVDIADFKNEKIKKLLDKNTSLVKADSRTFTPPFKIDFIFIDGDHSFDGVKNDFDHYLPYLNQGADILFHDAVGLKHVFASASVNSFVKTLEKKSTLKFIKDTDSLRHFKKI